MGVSQVAVSKILRAAEKRLWPEFVAHAELVKVRQTEQLEAIYDEAMQEWHRSKNDAERVTTVTGRVKALEGGMIDLPDQETRTVEGQTGNPALLEKALKAAADIRAIWGLNAPMRQEVSGPEGGPIRISEVIVELPGADGE